ncbi:MAG: TolC family protein [Sedimentisphaerales bacterium]|nr:TolC family protein [Sedimentisphaerales bacterium]
MSCLLFILVGLPGSPATLLASGKLSPTLSQVEQRLNEEARMNPSDPNSLAFQRATGEAPAREVEPRRPAAERVLTLDDCLRLAFTQNNEIRQTRELILGVGGSKIIVNSRFLPAIELINQYERTRAFDALDESAEAYSFGARITQRILEYGKDNPIDVTLRADQRDALFTYESRVANVFSQVRRAFLLIMLKERQITTRQELLEQFEKQYQVKQERLAAGNLSVKIEVLTAHLNVLNERSRINTLSRERFNRAMELLRLVGLPVGADQLKLIGEMDSFGLGPFELESMVRLALAQSSSVALAEAIVAEGERSLDQIRFEYWPDLRFTGGYQDRYGSAGATVSNQNDTWALDVSGQPQWVNSRDETGRGLGLFGNEVSVGGPDPGWFAGLQVRIPVADGNLRKGEKIEARAFLNRVKAALADQKDLVELNVRQSYKFLAEQSFQVELAQENVNIERERFQIQEEYRNVGKITDDQLETFRRTFFAAQDELFLAQEDLVKRQEDLRLAIRYFK